MTEEPESRAPRLNLDLPHRKEWGLKPERRGRSLGPFLIVVLLLVVISLQALSFYSGGDARKADSAPASPEGGPLTGIPLKELSARLQQRNLPSAAVEVLERYLSALDAGEIEKRRKTLITLGDLLMKANRHEEAIVRFYEAEYLGVSGDDQSHINRQVVACLEKLGKNDELQYELADRTRKPGGSPAGPGASPGSEAASRVVASIGVERITASDLSALIAERVDAQLASRPDLTGEKRKALRDQLLKQYSDSRARLQVLRDIVALKVLYREGVQRGLDKSETVQRQLDRAREGLIAQEVVMRASEDLNITEGDLEIFYRAESDRYRQPASASVRIAVFETADAAKEARAGVKSEADFEALARAKSTHEASRAQGGLLPSPVTAAGVPGLGAEPALAAAILATPEGQVTEPVAVQSGHAIAFVRKQSPARLPPFEEVRERVGRDYVARKENEARQKLIQELFEKFAVNIRTEAFISTGEGGKAGKREAGTKSGTKSATESATGRDKETEKEGEAQREEK